MARKKRAWSTLRAPEYKQEQQVSDNFQKVLEEKDKLIELCDGQVTMAKLKNITDELDFIEDEAEKERKARNQRYRALEILILEQLTLIKDIAGTDQWRSEDGHLFSPKYTPRPVVSDAVAFDAWITARGLDHMRRVPNKEIVKLTKEALDEDLAAMLSPDQRSQLQPGDPASGAPPPGVTIYKQTSVNHTSPGRATRGRDDENVDED